ncbi:TetR/AcrR family transcriptional regulator [Paucidesulfovibrio longus]|uniref:TetR/AcrR family transcriptional regulator n=1 Tax=Paucidesulfovibrio longus TaxID=889 RepID=UPI0003B47A84|nr:TetR/AcrR family transcriptional regulator [Paucidesulfovibrio longus]
MTKAKIGRPRSERTREAILRAAHELLIENRGVCLTMEAVARRAGVGRPTLYRWWPTLADIVLEAVLRLADEEIAVSARESLRETLREFLRGSVRAILDGGGAHLRFLMARAQEDGGFRERFREGFAAKRRAVLNSIFTQAAEQGRIGLVHDPDMLADVVFGAMWYRLLVGHASLDEAFADELADVAMALVRAGAGEREAG